MENIPIRYINSNLKELNFSESFSIRNIQDLFTDKDLVQELHRHDFFYILVLKKGDGNHEIDFLPYKFCNHSVFFMRPGQVHQLTLKEGSTGFLIQFKTEFYYSQNKISHQLLRKASKSNFFQFDEDKFSQLNSILNYIFQEYINKHEGFQEVIKANLGIFFIELIRNISNKEIPLNNSNLYILERLEEFLELLETHIYKLKKVSDYADILNLSSYQLNAITKSALGKTCSEIIDEYIILESKRFLIATSNQVNQIANNLGYDDVSYFIRFFKKHTGFSPEAFRQNFK